jgi:serine/threonine protein kinase
MYELISTSVPCPNSHFYQIFFREITVWREFQHPNITPFLGVSYDFDRLSIPCLVSPLYRNGNILDYIQTQPNVDLLPLVSCFIISSEEIVHSVTLRSHKLLVL